MAFSTSYKYTHLTESADDTADITGPNTAGLRSRTHVLKFRAGTQLTLLAVLIVSLFGNLGLTLLAFSLTECRIPAALYSPAQDILAYKDHVFDSGFGLQTTAYQGTPSESNDKLWSDLYSVGITRITSDEARPMANKTLPIPDDEEHYIVQLSVFHQLHCLNMIRHGLYNQTDWSNENDLLGIEHLDHCIDSIRQSLMCSADITPLTWARDATERRAKAVAEVVHTCRDFSAVRQWAANRQLKGHFNYTTVVTSDPLNWGDYEIETRIVTDD